MLKKILKILKGQSTTEYLISLAVIIVIALIVAFIMGWYPGASNTITINQSKAYWQSTNPISITDWQVYNNGKIDLVLKNNSLNPIIITDFYINGKRYNIFNTTLYHSKIFTIYTDSNFKEIAQIKISIGYITNNIQFKLTGKKPIIANVINTNENVKVLLIDSNIELKNYQVKINLSNIDINNISFYDVYGNKLNYWIQDSNENNPIIWLKMNIPNEIIIKNIPAPENPKEVFIYFKKFNDLNNWIVTPGSNLTVNNYLTIYNGSITQDNNLSVNLENGYAIFGKVKYLTIEQYKYSGAFSASETPFIAPNNNTGKALVSIFMHYPGRLTFLVGSGATTGYDCASADTIYIDANTDYLLEHRIKNNNAKMYVNNNLIKSVDCNWAKPIKILSLGEFSGTYGDIADTVYYWIAVRKYINDNYNVIFIKN